MITFISSILKMKRLRSLYHHTQIVEMASKAGVLINTLTV